MLFGEFIQFTNSVLPPAIATWFFQPSGLPAGNPQQQLAALSQHPLALAKNPMFQCIIQSQGPSLARPMLALALTCVLVAWSRQIECFEHPLPSCLYVS